MNRHIPRFLIWFGVPFAVAAGILAVRLVIEQTIMSWRGGPQMIGGSAHSIGNWGLVFFVLAGLLWLLVYSVYAILSRTLGGRLGIFVMTFYLVSIVICRIPYETWQQIFAARIVNGGHAGDFMTRAAAMGDAITVKSFIAAGVNVDARNEGGSSALQIAAENRQFDVCEFLISEGADINALDNYGRSPLAHTESYEMRNRREVCLLYTSDAADE